MAGWQVGWQAGILAGWQVFSLPGWHVVRMAVRLAGNQAG